LTISNSPDSGRVGIGSTHELDLSRVGNLYLALGWDQQTQADFFFETVSIYMLSLEELKILYLLQLTDKQKMSDPLAKLCQLDSEWGSK
jgi:hypothetical protein